jgi:Reverse transcriptase (RNA-dependent DNA polymerase)
MDVILSDVDNGRMGVTLRKEPAIAKKVAGINMRVKGACDVDVEEETRRSSTQNASGEESNATFVMIDRFAAGVEGLTLFEAAYSHSEVDPTKYADIYENPKTFDEAWNHPEPFQREKWREGINKEFDRMASKKVWTKIKRSQMEKGRRCVKHKWVFLIKRSGTFRSRLVACGYSQIPGTDFDLMYSAVANDMTFRMILIAMLTWKLSSLIFDVETAFLHGDLSIPIYMDCPAGMEHDYYSRQGCTTKSSRRS